MNRNFKRKTLFLLLSGLALCIFSLPVGHASALTLTPVRFELSGSPGDSITEEVLLINEESVASYFYATYANFEAQGDSGTPAFVEPKEGLGTWMKTDLESIYLEPNQQKVIKLNINIPKDAEPGGYFGVVFFGTSPGDNSGVSVGAQTGILVLLSVKGDVREEAGLLNFNTVEKKFFYQTLPVSFEYRFRNDGGDRIKPTGTLTIRNSVFLPTERLDGNPVEGNVLPGSTRKIAVNWQKYERPDNYVMPAGFFKKFLSDVAYQWKNFAVGLYSAKLDVTYGTQGDHAKGKVFFFVFPWQLVLIMLLVIIIVFWGGKKIITRYNNFIISRAKVGMGPSNPTRV